MITCCRISDSPTPTPTTANCITFSAVVSQQFRSSCMQMMSILDEVMCLSQLPSQNNVALHLRFICGNQLIGKCLLHHKETLYSNQYADTDTLVRRQDPRSERTRDQALDPSQVGALLLACSRLLASLMLFTTCCI